MDTFFFNGHVFFFFFKCMRSPTLGLALGRCSAKSVLLVTQTKTCL